MKALDKYRQLLKDAQMLEELAGEKAGGPSFWNDMRACTGAAIACQIAGGPPEGTTWKMSHAQMMAIYHVSSRHLPKLWLDAAANVRASAARMLDDLKKEQAELSSAIASLEEKP